MSDKKQRYRELERIPPFARIDHRHFLNEKGELKYTAGLSRAERRKLQADGKRVARQYGRILRSIATSGAGFPIDKLLRQMAIEYTHRFASSGTYTQPVSFNYFEPFCHIKLIKGSVAPYIELTDECDHLFYAVDFFDYLTSSDSNGFALESLLELPAEKTFHFSTNGDVTDISFLNSENREFVISGFSMVRRGSSLYWYLLGGEILEEEEWKLRCSNNIEVDIAHLNPLKRAFLLDSIKEENPSSGPPMPLEGTKTAIRTIAAGEMDLRSNKHLSRVVMTEHENAFPLFCDDPEILIGISDEDKSEKIKESMVNRINNASVLWSLAEGFFQLPSYFSCRLPLEKEVLSKTGKRLSRKRGGNGIGKKFKVVSAIEVTTKVPTTPIIRINLPHYEIETEGHWRRLARDTPGRGRDGEKIIGKTWVEKSSPWRAKENGERIVFVKDSISAARIKIFEYVKAAQETDERESQQECARREGDGELYVMRCAAMKETIFKVGYTEGDSYRRAEQLSSATGVPLSFIVVRVWKHQNAEALEKEVHMMLAPYQINESREFFLANYSVIEKIIEATIERTGTK